MWRAGLRACSSWSASTSATMASTMGTARGTTHGSCRPRATRSVSSPSRLTCAAGVAGQGSVAGCCWRPLRSDQKVGLGCRC